MVVGRNPVGDLRGTGVEKLGAVETIHAMKAAVHTRYGPPVEVRRS
jgi:hypothetical protein